MSKHSAAPTLSWAFFANIYKWFSGIVIAILIVCGITIYAIKYSLDKNCTDFYKREITVFGYWVNVKGGSTADGCPNLNT